MNASVRKYAPVLVLAAAAGAGIYGSVTGRRDGPGPGFASGNGRIEATELDVATKLPGRVAEVLVAEGDFVEAGQVLARMQLESLEAQRQEADAHRQQALDAVAATEAQVALRESDRVASEAVVAARESDLDAARRRLARSETMAEAGSLADQQLDDDRARVRSAEAGLAAARAQAQAARAGIAVARAQVTGARSAVRAVDATIARVEAELADGVLRAPRAGRVQLRLVEPGEVIGAGGKVLSLVDLTDVQMTFFLPETVAGRVALGSEVRVVLDAAPGFVIPAKVSLVASTAQFTPRTVETASERQKLMFRVRARIDRALLEAHRQQVKTGLPGVAWVRTDPNVAWPAALAPKLPP